jgi:hypothetical protein
MSKKIKLLSLTAALALAALACNLNLGGPEAPTEVVPISTEAAGDLVDAWTRAFETARETGVISLTLTEEQLTSFVALSMAEKESIPLSNPQVTLRDGEMEISGSYDTGAITANVSIVMEVSVNAEGVPVIEVTSGSVGPLPVPPELLQGVSQVINEALTGQVASTASGFTLETIVITDEAITLTGMVE